MHFHLAEGEMIGRLSTADLGDGDGLNMFNTVKASSLQSTYPM